MSLAWLEAYAQENLEKLGDYPAARARMSEKLEHALYDGASLVELLQLAEDLPNE